MKEIIFVSLPKVEISFPPGAIAILSSIAEQNNYNVRVFDYNLDIFNQLTASEWGEFEAWNTLAVNVLSPTIQHKLEEIFKTNLKKFITPNTAYVAFSVFSYFSNRIAELALGWFKNMSTIPSIVGGSGVSTDTGPNNKEIFGDYLTRQKLVNYVIFGEGELTLDSLLKNQCDYPGINKNNPVQILDLTRLPTPTYNYFDMERYQNKKILITGSRGCVRHCTFCDIDLTWPKFRFRSAQNIVDEIKKHFYEYGITEFEFTDSLMNGSISNFDQFNEVLYNEKQKNADLMPIKYQGQFICRPSQKERSYELMHLAGCNQLITGIESFSNNVRKHMGKKFSNQDIDFHFEQCARWGIPNVLLMLVGYPTETPQDHQENLDAIVKYKPYVDMGTIFMVRWGFTMHLYQHTPIMNMLDTLGVNLNSDIRFDSIYSWSSSANTLEERIKRRIEIHELCVNLEYPMPRVQEELLILKTLAEKSQGLSLPSRKIIQLETI
jgi:hypothetical protein